VELPDVERRQLTVLKNALTMAAPADPKEAAELAQLVASMEGTYGRGKYCQNGESDEACLDIEEITEIMAKDRDPARLLDVWEGWHSIGRPMKESYARFVELSNNGARELGFPDTGAMWRSKYDMPPEAFSKELDRLWGQLQPLYLSLHTYMRARLREHYGDLVPENGPIPAHLLGNLWAQDWSNLYGNAEAGRRLRTTLEMGASRPWPDALEALTGQREMDASAMADYYAPLKAWLDAQNQGRRAGW
jgi:peptidyl-dipeptidase A